VAVTPVAIAGAIVALCVIDRLLRTKSHRSAVAAGWYAGGVLATSDWLGWGVLLALALFFAHRAKHHLGREEQLRRLQ
jgi:uncharacterized protein (DUF2062 family)